MRISIITPNYNYGAFICETIESVVKQDINYCEHIIVDDGSTDTSVDVINNYVSSFPKIIKLHCQENQGQTPAINKGLSLTTGEILGWINSDDTYCEGVFCRIIDFFETNPDVDVIFGDTNIIDVQGNFIKRKHYLDYNKYFGIFFGYANIMSSNTVFFRKSALHDCGPLNNSLKCNMDGEFFSRLCRNRKVRKMPFVIANFRKQPQSKAALNNNNWQQLVNNEVSFELKQSYKNTVLSHFLPYSLSFVVTFWFRLYRVFLRSIQLHYLIEYFQEKRYYNNK